MENRTVIDLGTLKNTASRMPLISVSGSISKIYDAKTFRRTTTQGVLLKDNTGGIFAKVADSPFTDRHIGCDVEITGAEWTSYKKPDGSDSWYLDATKADVRYSEAGAAITYIGPEKKPTENFDEEMTAKVSHFLDLSCKILTNPELGVKLNDVHALGWNSEDVRTIAISLFIESNRRVK